MKTTKESENNFPMFLMKLWKLVDDSETDDLICWSEHNGSSTFIIKNQVRFAKEILPLYFKHNNMASFIRQLNMYGFRKVANLDQGALKVEKDEIEFFHVYFAREHKNLLPLIKRKSTNVKASDNLKSPNDALVNILSDVSSLYTKQESVNTQLANMKRENEALWREVASLRQQHMKQQQIVNKMIQFLMTLVRSNRGLGTAKRKLPLMLDESPHNESQIARLTRTYSYDGTTTNELKKSSSSFGKASSSGPVIHDITDTFDTEAFLRGVEVKPNEIETVTADELKSQPVVHSPKSLEDIVNATVGDFTIDPVLSATNVSVKPDVLEELFSVLNSVDSPPNENLALPSAFDADSNRNSDKIAKPGDLLDHVGSTQLELDHLKEMLSSSGCNLDFSSVLGTFLPDSLLTRAGGSDFEMDKSGNEIVGNELIRYNPNMLLDLSGSEFLSLSDEITNCTPLFENLEPLDEDSQVPTRLQLKEEITEQQSDPAETSADIKPTT